MLSVLFVDADADGGGNGAGWDSAYGDLQDALAHAAEVNADGDPRDDVDQIWIAEGVYRPSEQLEPEDPRSATFSLVDGVTLHGGFAGTETTLQGRNWSAHVTTLSGDLGTVDDATDNAYTVVYCGGGVEASLDGLWVTGGNANGDYASGGHPERSDGGGVFINGGTLALTNSTILGNSAWGIIGGGGGGICNLGGTVAIANSVLVGNSTDGGGGGIWNNGTLTIANSTLSGNAAAFNGGGIIDAGTITINNSVLAGNSARSTPDVHIYSTLAGSNNLIGDGSGQTDLLHGHHGNLVGTSANPIDPRFVEAPSDGGDGWGDDPDTPAVDESANDDYGDLRLRADSPAVDAGGSGFIPADTYDLDGDGKTAEPVPFDRGGNARVEGAAVDMGAYEYTVVLELPGDLNSDGTVNSNDLDIVRANWGATVFPGSLLDGDPTGDGKVNSDDLNIVRANWGSTAPVAGGVLETTKSDPGTATPAAVYGPREATDAAMRNWGRARAAWVEAVEGLLRERGEGGKDEG